MKLHWFAAAGFALVASVAGAKLPPPTPEQQQAAAELKAKQAELLKKEQEALARVQDRIAERYKRTHAGAGGGAARGGVSQPGAIPNQATVPEGQIGPTGGKQQSAEAHSAPAK